MKRNTDELRPEYDFAAMKGRRNPFARLLKTPVTIRLHPDAVAYFKAMAQESGIPYQTLIDLYLRDCAASKRRVAVKWCTRRAKASPVAVK